MTIRELVVKEIESVAEYMAMLYNFSGNPVVFEYNVNGKTYNLILQEAVQPQSEPEEPKDVGCAPTQVEQV